MKTNKSIKLNVLNKNEMSSIHGGEAGSGIFGFCSCPCCCCCNSTTNKSVEKAITKADNCRCSDKTKQPTTPCD